MIDKKPVGYRIVVASDGGYTAKPIKGKCSGRAVTITAPFVGAPNGCTQPYSPLAWTPAPPFPSVPGVDVSSKVVSEPLDSDGDGVPDTVPEGGGSVMRVVRGDGTITFKSPGLDLDRPTNAGDLDGDGRDEILVVAHYPTNTRAVWVVPGTVSPGTHNVAKVGIRINPGLARTVIQPVPDRTGDGIQDLMQWPEGFTTITSGTAIMAVRAPGDARSVTPVLSMPGRFAGAAQLSSGPPTIITATPVQGGVEFRIGDDPSGPVFTTAPAPVIDIGSAHIGRVLVSDAGTYMIGTVDDGPILSV